MFSKFKFENEFNTLNRFSSIFKLDILNTFISFSLSVVVLLYDINSFNIFIYKSIPQLLSFFKILFLKLLNKVQALDI